MKLSWFVSIVMIVLVGMVQVFHWAKFNYSDRDLLKAQVRFLTHKLHESDLSNIVLNDRFEGFRQEVAVLMPDELNKRGRLAEGYALRGLASVTQSPRGAQSEKIKEALGITLFESGKKAFSEGNFSKSNSIFEKFIDRYGYSPKAPEAYFLLVEGLYQSAKLEESSEVIRKMVDLFPGNEVTGFAMIRLGDILQQRGRASDAIDLYKLVIKTFPQREVASQAMGSLKGAGL